MAGDSTSRQKATKSDNGNQSNVNKQGDTVAEAKRAISFTSVLTAPIRALDVTEAKKLFTQKRGNLYAFWYQWFWWMLFLVTLLFALLVWGLTIAEKKIPEYAPKAAAMSEWFADNVVSELNFTYIKFDPTTGVTTDLIPQPTDIVFYLRGFDKCIPERLGKTVAYWDGRQVIIVGCEKLVAGANVFDSEALVNMLKPASAVLTIDTEHPKPRLFDGVYFALGIGREFFEYSMLDPTTGESDVRITPVYENPLAYEDYATRVFSKKIVVQLFEKQVPSLILKINDVFTKKSVLGLLIETLKAITLTTIMIGILPLVVLSAAVVVLLYSVLAWLAALFAAVVLKLLVFRDTGFADITTRVKDTLYWFAGVMLAGLVFVGVVSMTFPSLMSSFMNVVDFIVRLLFAPVRLGVAGIIMTLLVYGRGREA